MEIKSFFFVGILSVFLDFIFYRIFLSLNFSIYFSKGFSFLIGALFAYYANKKFTFNAIGSKKVFFRFLVIYVMSLFLNVFLNSNIVNFLNIKKNNALIFAFFIATICSAFFNFIGLKKFVFKLKLK